MDYLINAWGDGGPGLWTVVGLVAVAGGLLALQISMDRRLGAAIAGVSLLSVAAGWYFSTRSLEMVYDSGICCSCTPEQSAEFWGTAEALALLPFRVALILGGVVCATALLASLAKRNT